MRDSESVAMMNDAINKGSASPKKPLEQSIINYSTPDRNQETASLFAIGLYFSFTFAGVLISHFYPLPSAVILLWIGLGVVLLVRISGIATNYDIVAFGFMLAFVPLSIYWWSAPLHPLLTEFAIIIILLQATLLVWRLRSFPRTETMGQRVFYGSLYALCAYFRLLSICFIFKSVGAWPSTATTSISSSSFYFAMASCLFFAYASWLGSKVSSGPRADDSDPSIYSCSSGSSERPNFWIYTLLAMVLHAPTAYSLLSSFTFWTPASDMETLLFLLDLTLFCFASALFLQVMLLAPLRLYVLPDASILVETLGHTYVYDKAVRVLEGPVGEPPDGSNKCHVYCDTSLPMIVVELTEGRFLHVTPKSPNEFISALTRATASVDGKDVDLEQQSS